MDKEKALAAIERFRKDSILATHPSGTLATSDDVQYLIRAIEKLATALVDAIDQP